MERKVEQIFCYLRYYCNIRYDEYDWKSICEKIEEVVLCIVIFTISGR